MDVAPPSTRGCLRSQHRFAYPDALEALDADNHNDNRLPPEEEEGVNEEPILDSLTNASNLNMGPTCSTMHLSGMHWMNQEIPGALASMTWESRGVTKVYPVAKL